MNEKYLFNGKEYDKATVEQFAKDNNTDFDTYVSEIGATLVDDKPGKSNDTQKEKDATAVSAKDNGASNSGTTSSASPEFDLNKIKEKLNTGFKLNEKELDFLMKNSDYKFSSVDRKEVIKYNKEQNERYSSKGVKGENTDEADEKYAKENNLNNEYDSYQKPYYNPSDPRQKSLKIDPATGKVLEDHTGESGYKNPSSYRLFYPDTDQNIKNRKDIRSARASVDMQLASGLDFEMPEYSSRVSIFNPDGTLAQEENPMDGEVLIELLNKQDKTGADIARLASAIGGEIDQSMTQLVFGSDGFFPKSGLIDGGGYAGQSSVKQTGAAELTYDRSAVSQMETLLNEYLNSNPDIRDKAYSYVNKKSALNLQEKNKLKLESEIPLKTKKVEKTKYTGRTTGEAKLTSVSSKFNFDKIPALAAFDFKGKKSVPTYEGDFDNAFAKAKQDWNDFKLSPVFMWGGKPFLAVTEKELGFKMRTDSDIYDAKQYTADIEAEIYRSIEADSLQDNETLDIAYGILDTKMSKEDQQEAERIRLELNNPENTIVQKDKYEQQYFKLLSDKAGLKVNTSRTAGGLMEDYAPQVFKPSFWGVTLDNDGVERYKGKMLFDDNGSYVRREGEENTEAIHFNPETQTFTPASALDQEQRNNTFTIEQAIEQRIRQGDIPSDQDARLSLMTEQRFEVLAAAEALIGTDNDGRVDLDKALYSTGTLGFYNELFRGLAKTGIIGDGEAADPRFLQMYEAFEKGDINALPLLPDRYNNPQIREYNTMVNNFKMTATAYLLNYDVTTLAKNDYKTELIKSAADYIGADPTMGGSIVDNDEIMQEAYKVFSDTGIELPKKDIDYIMEMSFTGSLGAETLPMVQVVAEFALTRKLAGGGIKKLCNALTKIGGSSLGWSGQAGTVGARRMNLFEAVLDEYMVIGASNLGRREADKFNENFAIGMVAGNKLFNSAYNRFLGSTFKNKQYQQTWNMVMGKRDLSFRSTRQNLTGQLVGATGGAFGMSLGEVAEHSLDYGYHSLMGEGNSEEYNNFMADVFSADNFAKKIALNLSMTATRPIGQARTTYKALKRDFQAATKSKVPRRNAAKTLGLNVEELYNEEDAQSVRTEKINKAIKQKLLERSGIDGAEMIKVEQALVELGLNIKKLPKDFNLNSFLSEVNQGNFELIGEGVNTSTKESKLSKEQQAAANVLTELGFDKKISNYKEASKILGAGEYLKSNIFAKEALDQMSSTELDMKIKAIDKFVDRISNPGWDGNYSAEDVVVLSELPEVVISEILKESGFSEQYIKGQQKTIIAAKGRVGVLRKKGIQPTSDLGKKWLNEAGKQDRIGDEITLLNKELKADYTSSSLKEEIKNQIAKKELEIESIEKKKLEIETEADVILKENIKRNVELAEQEGGGQTIGFESTEEMNAELDRLFAENKIDKDYYLDVKEAQEKGYVYKGHAITVDGKKIQLLDMEQMYNLKDPTTGQHENLHPYFNEKLSGMKGAEKKQFISEFIETMNPREYEIVLDKVKKHPDYANDNNTIEWLNIYADSLIKGELDWATNTPKELAAVAQKWYRKNTPAKNIEISDAEATKRFIHNYAAGVAKGEVNKYVANAIAGKATEEAPSNAAAEALNSQEIRMLNDIKTKQGNIKNLEKERNKLKETNLELAKNKEEGWVEKAKLNNPRMQELTSLIKGEQEAIAILTDEVSNIDKAQVVSERALETSENNKNNVDIFKSDEADPLAKTSALERLKQDNKGYINLLLRKFDPTKGDMYTREEWTKAVYNEFEDLIMTYDKSKGPFGPYIKKILPLRDGDVIRKLKGKGDETFRGQDLSSPEMSNTLVDRSSGGYGEFQDGKKVGPGVKIVDKLITNEGEKIVTEEKVSEIQNVLKDVIKGDFSIEKKVKGKGVEKTNLIKIGKKSDMNFNNIMHADVTYTNSKGEQVTTTLEKALKPVMKDLFGKNIVDRRINTTRNAEFLFKQLSPTNVNSSGQSMGIGTSVLSGFYGKAGSRVGYDAKEGGAGNKVQPKLEWGDGEGQINTKKLLNYLGFSIRPGEKGYTTAANRQKMFFEEVTNNMANQILREELMTNKKLRTELKDQVGDKALNDIKKEQYLNTMMQTIGDGRAASLSSAEKVGLDKSDMEAAYNLMEKYEISENEFKNVIKGIAAGDLIVDEEMQLDVSQFMLDVLGKDQSKADNASFGKLLKGLDNKEAISNIANTLKLDNKEAKKLVKELNDLPSSFMSKEEGEKVWDEPALKEYKVNVKKLYDMAFGGDMTNVGDKGILKQLLTIGERTTRETELEGVDLNDVTKEINRDLLSERSQKIYDEMVENGDFAKLKAQNITKSTAWKNIFGVTKSKSRDKYETMSAQEKYDYIAKNTDPQTAKALNNMYRYILSVEGDMMDNAIASGDKPLIKSTAKFLSQFERMNSNLVVGKRAMYPLRYGDVKGESQFLDMTNPEFRDFYNQKLNELTASDITAEEHPKNKKRIEDGKEILSLEEIALMDSKYNFKPKGEHLEDSSTDSYLNLEAILFGKGSERVQEFGDSKDSKVQLIAKNFYMNKMDAAFGTNPYGSQYEGVLRLRALEPTSANNLKILTSNMQDFQQPGNNMWKQLNKETAGYLTGKYSDFFKNKDLNYKTNVLESTSILDSNYEFLSNVRNGASSAEINKSAEKLRTHSSFIKDFERAREHNKEQFQKIKTTPEFSEYMNTIPTNLQVKLTSSIDKASALQFKYDAKPNKKAFFDVDDTLFTTNNKVYITLPASGKRITISAAEYAEQYPTYKAMGAEFDYSDFANMTEAKRGPMAGVWSKMAARWDGSLNILTARAPNVAESLHPLLLGITPKKFHFKVPTIEEIRLGCVGSSYAMAKTLNIVDRGFGEGANVVSLFDDAGGNIKSAYNNLGSLLNVKTKFQLVGNEISIEGQSSAELTQSYDGMIEHSTGIKADQRFSIASAKAIAPRSKGGLMRYSARDFEGLQEVMLGKGEKGEENQRTLNAKWNNPYWESVKNYDEAMLNLGSDFKTTKKTYGIDSKIMSQKAEGQDIFTNDQAVRVYLWDKQGYKIPGLDAKEQATLVNSVINNPKLGAYAEDLIRINKSDGTSRPGEAWMTGTVESMMLDGTHRRHRMLEESGWKANIDYFLDGGEMEAKAVAAYGQNWVDNMKLMTGHMFNGRANMMAGKAKWERATVNYVQGAIGGTMAVNTRSAITQLLSTFNYNNATWNNPFRAAKAAANIPKYTKDIMELFNDPRFKTRMKLDQRELYSGDIAMNAEGLSAALSGGKKIRGGYNYLMKHLGFMTKGADGAAILLGGAIRKQNYEDKLNRIAKRQSKNISELDRNQLKAEFAEYKGDFSINDMRKFASILSEEQIKNASIEDWWNSTRKSQQSNDPAMTSAQQNTTLGRTVLSYGNTSMQYARKMDRAFKDLVKGRGNAADNIGIITYYGALQQGMFAVIQQAAFAWGDEEDSEWKQKKVKRLFNSIIDSNLKGVGLLGATASYGKNLAIKAYEQYGVEKPSFLAGEKVVDKLPDIFVPGATKYRHIKAGLKNIDYNMKQIKTDPTAGGTHNPLLESSARIVQGVTNTPMYSALQNIQNVEAAISGEWEGTILSPLERAMLIGGFSVWDFKDMSKKSKKNKKYKEPKSNSAFQKSPTFSKENKFSKSSKF